MCCNSPNTFNLLTDGYILASSMYICSYMFPCVPWTLGGQCTWQCRPTLGIDGVDTASRFGGFQGDLKAMAEYSKWTMWTWSVQNTLKSKWGGGLSNMNGCTWWIFGSFMIISASVISRTQWKPTPVRRILSLVVNGQSTVLMIITIYDMWNMIRSWLSIRTEW